MRTVERIADLRAAVGAARARGLRVGLVPTMGFLHEGHLRLVDEARRHCAFVVMSIFVNPLQFGPTEDFSRYPRDLGGDGAKAAARGVDVLFVPSREEMYPAERAVTVVPQGLDARWEGEVRPGHFAGVLTVVAKLFNLVQPDVAVFGQKDFQQAALVRAMVRDLDFPIELVVVPTVREPDGLALSSRNSYLSAEDRVRARALSAALREMQRAWRAGTRGADAIAAVGRARLERDAPGARIDYLAVVDPATLAPAREATDESVALVAARLGGTRLIDNAPLGVPLDDATAKGA
ncbi:MAG: pantoate--beta-alanine ligase [Gemmatimonadaceae bacterium]